MSTYWIVVCDELREWIDPSDIAVASDLSNRGGVVAFAIAHGPAMPVIAMRCMFGAWDGHAVRFVSDAGRSDVEQGRVVEQYRDVTADAVEEYNADVASRPLMALPG
jgi:hypothetical protein